VNVGVADDLWQIRSGDAHFTRIRSAQGYEPGMTSASTTAMRPATIGVAAAFAAQVSMTLGAAIAKQLFPVVGAYGVTGLRVTLAALLLVALRRPWRRPFPRGVLPALIAYGAVLGMMNLLIYQAFARIPLGIATGIEVTGPLVIVLLGSRRASDFLWLAAACLGLALLLPLGARDPLDPVGIAFALGAAACWALYIVYGTRVSGALGRDAVAWGMLVSASFALPIGLATSGGAILAPGMLATGFGIAILSSALPYSLEMEAMRRVPAAVFGILVSSSPAIAALIGFVMLGETLTALQGGAILCIVVAAAGSAISATRRS
jgi:inner membrane transporter RhtA